MFTEKIVLSASEPATCCLLLFTCDRSETLERSGLGSAFTFQLPAISYQLPAFTFQLSALTFQLPATRYQLSPISYQQSAISNQLSPFTIHYSLFPNFSSKIRSMEIKIAIAKIDKHGSSNSGDTVEMTERPNGGISIVMADGKIDNRDSKAISNLVVHRVIEQISQGVRDGASIRAAASNIFSEHQGRVQANLNVLSVDLQTDTIIISRNNPVPVFLITEERADCLSTESKPIGKVEEVTSSIVEIPIEPDLSVVLFSDGVYHAGQHDEATMDICTIMQSLVEEQEPTARELADFLLNRAIRLDNGQPQDDMSIIVLMVSFHPTDAIRRMHITMPLD